MAELRVFLELLDREYLTAGVREKKQQILNILHRVLATKGKHRFPLATFLSLHRKAKYFISVSVMIYSYFVIAEPSCKTEIHTSLPAPPQMPLPEIPHPWMVRRASYHLKSVVCVFCATSDTAELSKNSLLTSFKNLVVPPKLTPLVKPIQINRSV